MAINPDKNAVEQGLIARLIGKIKRIVLDINGAVSAEETRAQAAEGLKADKVQGATAGNLAALDANGNLTDSGKKAADFATAEQGTKADSAVQGVKVNGTELSKDGNNKVDVPVPTASTATPLKDGTASAGSSAQWARGDHRHPTDDSREAVSNKKQSIDPTSTTEYGSSKAVADFVNSSVATNTANFLGSFSLTDLGLTYPATDVQIAAVLNSHTWPSGVTPTNNDYVYVEIQNPQTTGVDDKVERFKYSGLLASWGYEYTLNNSSFTAAEMATLESGITASDKTNWNNHVSNTNNPHNVTPAQIGAEPAFSVLPIDKGGTGKTTATAAANNFIYNLAAASANITSDDCEIITGDANHSSGNLLTFYKRKVSGLWAYIQGKILGWYDWTRVNSGTGRYAKICSIADPASGTSYTVDVLVTRMTSYYAVSGIIRIAVSHGSSSVQASILASDSSFYAVDSGNPPKVYTYVDGNGKRTFVFDTASAYQTAQGFVFRAVGGFSDKWSFFGDVGCSNDAADLGSIGTKQDALDVTFVFASYAKTAGHAATATSADNATSATNADYAYRAGSAANYESGGGIADALAGKSNTSHVHDDRYVRFDANNQGLNDTQKSNARTNIGAGTSSLTLGITTNDAARGNHAHGLLDRDGYLSDQNWAVSNLDRLVIAKNNYNGKVGYLVPSALNFDSDEKNKALTQSAEWKPFLPPNGDGSSVSVTPDGTSTGTDIGDSTTLKVWAQKFKNLVSGLGRAAYKNTPTNGWNASSSEVVMGNDTRLTDARTPTAHNHDTLYLKSPSSKTLQWGDSIVIGTYNGNNITLTMPANPFDPNGDYSSNTLRANTAVSADSAQYATGASNYTAAGSIASALSLRAPLKHEHSASDVTSGTFGASRLDIGIIRKSGNYLVPRMPILWANGNIDLTTSTDSVSTAVRDNGYGTPITIINGTASSITVTGIYPNKGTTTIPARKSRIFTYYNSSNGFFEST